jgi:hypothetical protein
VTALLGITIDVSFIVIGAQILVASIGIFQQVPDDHQDGAPDGDHCPGLTATSGDAPVQGCPSASPQSTNSTNPYRSRNIARSRSLARILVSQREGHSLRYSIPYDRG